jgi:hypothetical protein
VWRIRPISDFSAQTAAIGMFEFSGSEDGLSPVDRQHVQKAETNEHFIALYAY